MKFNKTLTASRSPIEGLEEYEKAFQSGNLRKIAVYPTAERAMPGIWEKFVLDGVVWRDAPAAERLEVTAMRIRPRSLVIDELTRHPTTDQVFIPVTAGFLAVAGPSLPTDPTNPDPDCLNIIPVLPGEAINIKAGAWHTLPFAMVQDFVCLSVMYQQDLDAYHDLRDLAASGWVAIPNWRDPERAH